MRRGVVTRDRDELFRATGLHGFPGADAYDGELAAAAAESLAREAGANYALAVLIDVDEGPDRRDLSGLIQIAIAGPTGTVTRNASKKIEVRIRAVWDGEHFNQNITTGEPEDLRGTWVYWRQD